MTHGLKAAHKKENRDERFAKKWLQSQGYIDLCKLPQGCDPPDYKVTDGCNVYGVEVTRLAQENIETLDRSLEDLIQSEVIDKLNEVSNTSRCSCTCFVSFDVPDEGWDKKRTRKTIRSVFCSHNSSSKLDMLLELKSRLKSECGINFNLHFSHDCHDDHSDCEAVRFEIGAVGSSDGGWVNSILRETILCSIKGKSRKVRANRDIGDYSEWWLLLVDYVAFDGRVSGELKTEVVRNKDFWSRVIVVHPENVQRYSIMCM